MKLVVDANLVFSCIVRSDGHIGDILLRSSERYEFFAPTLLMDELDKHRTKLRKMARMDEPALDTVMTAILRDITLVREPLLSKANLRKAEKLLTNVDLFDVPYLALALDIDCPLWTGDKKLIRGLRERRFDQVVSTEDLLKML